MTIPFYQVDAFSDRPFGGNPAAVCVLESWPSDGLLGAIAAENNLSETAFLVHEDEGWRVRWFTPASEVNLCGHATLAAGHIAYTVLGEGAKRLTFASRSGPLHVGAEGGGRYRLDLPRTEVAPCSPPPGLLEALGLGSIGADAVHRAGEDYLLRLSDAAALDGVAPDFGHLARVETRGVIVTAPGVETDFCSRFFAPAVAVPEDPVTGSAHCALGPYWAQQLGRNRLEAEQRSARGGRLTVTVGPERVALEGAAITVISGSFHLPADA